MLFKLIVLVVLFEGITAGTDTRLGANKGYTLEYFFKATWNNAYLFCRYHGLRLATVETAEQHAYLAKMIVDGGFAKEHFWVSGSDAHQEGQFAWYGDGNKLQYTNWAPGQPDNYQGNENCMDIWVNQKWNDENCGVQNYFVCEKPICVMC